MASSMRPFKLAVLVCSIAFSSKVFSGPVHIHQLCKLNHSSCLDTLQQEYSKIKPQSFTWYQYKLYEIEAYFQLKPVKDRIELIRPLLALESAPINFKISVYIDYAKSMYFAKNYDESRIYANKAKELIQLSVDTFDSPIKLVQLTNLTAYLISVDHELGLIKDKKPEYDKAYRFLHSVLKRYKRNTDALFWAEIHSNLGHLKNHIAENQAALDHYIAAIPWFKSIGNRQQLGIGYSNVAKMIEKLNELKRALHYYRRAAVEFKASNDAYSLIVTDLNMVEVHIKLNETEQALSLFNAIDTGKLVDFNISKYDAVKAKIQRLKN